MKKNHIFLYILDNLYTFKVDNCNQINQILSPIITKLNKDHEAQKHYEQEKIHQKQRVIHKNLSFSTLD